MYFLSKKKLRENVFEHDWNVCVIKWDVVQRWKTKFWGRTRETWRNPIQNKRTILKRHNHLRDYFSNNYWNEIFQMFLFFSFWGKTLIFLHLTVNLAWKLSQFQFVINYCFNSVTRKLMQLIWLRGSSTETCGKEVFGYTELNYVILWKCNLFTEIKFIIVWNSRSFNTSKHF